MSANERAVEMLMAAIELLPDDEAKIQCIWDIARNTSLSWSPDDSYEWIKRVIATTRDTLTVPFCQQIQEHWGNRGLMPGYRGFQNLAHGVVLNLTDCLASDKKDGLDLNDTIMSIFFDTAIFFCRLLVDTDSIGAVQKLLRLFGEMASVDLYRGLAKEELADPDMPKALKEAIAEGQIKRVGADFVLKIFLGTVGSKPDRDNMDEINAVKDELRVVCANRGTDVASTSTRKDTLMTLLDRMMGPVAALKWFKEEFEDTIPQPSG